MSYETVSLDVLIPDPANARKHSERNIEEISRSLCEFGQHRPYVVQRSTGRIIIGNGMYEAMLLLKWTEGQAVYVDDDDTRAIRRALADNRTAELAEWDENVLAALLRSVANDGEIPGWTALEVESLLDVRELDYQNEDKLPEIQPQIVSELGDLWLLGKHRLICGDCTDTDTVMRLFNGARPHLMVTDPPYGVEYDPAWRNKAMNINSKRTGVVLNDDRADWEAAWKLFPGDVAYVWHASMHGETVARSLRNNDFAIRAQIVWAKPHFVLGRGDYHWQHECCLYATRDTSVNCPDDMPNYCDGYAVCWYAVRESKKSHWQGSRKMSTLWSIDFSGQDTATTHSTQKPVACMRRPIVNNSKRGDIVYEPFLGSGTTLIAAESESRTCYAAELNPEYIDMAIRRWQAFTGQKAVHESGELFDQRCAHETIAH